MKKLSLFILLFVNLNAFSQNISLIKVQEYPMIPIEEYQWNDLIISHDNKPLLKNIGMLPFFYFNSDTAYVTKKGLMWKDNLKKNEPYYFSLYNTKESLQFSSFYLKGFNKKDELNISLVSNWKDTISMNFYAGDTILIDLENYYQVNSKKSVFENLKDKDSIIICKQINYCHSSEEDNIVIVVNKDSCNISYHGIHKVCSLQKMKQLFIPLEEKAMQLEDSDKPIRYDLINENHHYFFKKGKLINSLLNYPEWKLFEKVTKSIINEL